jgi:hypothetical protein
VLSLFPNVGIQASLPFFITDEELALMTEMVESATEAKAALQENRPCTFDIMQDAKKMITTSFLSDITNILMRSLAERQQYLTQLEQEREGLATEADKTSRGPDYGGR